MHKIIVFSFLFLLTNVQSGEVKCNVQNFIDAINCIKIDSYQRYQEGEMPHSIGATKYDIGKEVFARITEFKPTKTYVGVVQVHYDEDQLLYYQIDKGENVSPELILDINMVDIGYPREEFTLEELMLHIPNIRDFHD